MTDDDPTEEEEQVFVQWWSDYLAWRARPNRKMHELRDKPKGFDLWRQGKDALGLDRAGYIPVGPKRRRHSHEKHRKRIDDSPDLAG